MPHVMGPVGGPSPASPNEVKLLAEIAGLSTQLNRIRLLLDVSPIGPTRTELGLLAFQIRQVIDEETTNDGR